MSMDFTRLSEKGQVVIPNEMRKRMNLKEGTRFVVLGLDDTIVLRRLEVSQEKLRLKRLLAESRAKAEKAGFTEKEIEHLIQSSRKIA
jgi:AbrB family looped-hinge helix DNA binding protein